ncbi:MAG: TraE/TraK family type IV conjugative transfer system protein [Burkholderiales bacterium]|nr:TraE/TraK family type IV conjugative transfer system protein [Burkholderiales bacterium]
MRKIDFDEKIANLERDSKWHKKLNIIFAVIIFILVVLDWASFNYERLVIVPASNPEYSYWVKNGEASNEYLESLSRDLLNLSLNVSPETVKKQYEAFLKFVTPSLRSYIIDNLKKSAENIIENDISQSFYIDQMKIVPSKQIVYVSGFLKTYVNNQQVTNVQQIYKIKFKAEDLTVKVEQYRLLDPQHDSVELKGVGI